MIRIPTVIASALLAASPAAADFSAIGDPCAVELGKPAPVERFGDMKALYDAIRLESDDPVADAAAAAKALCGDAGCTAGAAIDHRNGVEIHVIIPDAKGGAALLRGMGWIGGASACSIGEPTIKAHGDGLYQLTIDERTGEFRNDENGYCTDDGTATSALLLDLGQARWLVYATAIGGDGRLVVSGGRVTAKACGRTLDASLAELKAGEAQLKGAPAPKKPADAALAKACEKAWPAAKTADRQQTWACLTHYLTYAYGQPPTAEMMTLDPGYGHPVEAALSVADLSRMVAHVEAACDIAGAPVESECARGHELFTGMRHRRMGLSEGVEVGSIEPALRKVLAGEKLSRADVLADDPDVALSALSLWKLRNAAYARHGYRFKTPDLNTFFYGPREAVGEPKLLPLAIKGATKKVTLDANDGANVRLIKELEARTSKAR